jgi:hypothetical protein
VLVQWICRSVIGSPRRHVPTTIFDGGFHVVGQDDELRRPAVVMGAKTYDVDLSHSGRKNNEKTRGEQEGGRVNARPLLAICLFSFSKVAL